jgi:hypothetical protein
MSKTLTQRERILSYLRSGNHLNQSDASLFFGCQRLASRIDELRKMGHNIRSRMVVVPASGVRFASYSLVERRTSDLNFKPGREVPREFHCSTAA